MNINISNVTLLPLSLFPKSTVRFTRSLGIGIQMVPVWGAYQLGMALQPDEVSSLEPAWSYEPLISRLKRKDYKGALIDTAFFGSPTRSIQVENFLLKRFPDALRIDFDGGVIKEVAFRKGSTEAVNDFMHRKVVFDSWHIRELDNTNPIPSLERLSLFSKVVALHLQTRYRPELDEFVKTGKGYLADFLTTFKHLDVPIVIELMPNQLGTSPKETLKTVVNRIQDLTS